MSPSPLSHSFTPDTLSTVYQQMVLIRRFEEQVQRFARSGLTAGLVHLCSGQEATAVGVCHLMKPDDYLASSHRGHGHSLAKGMQPDRLLAEILGKADGYCGGRGGSMHVSDPALGHLGTNGIVGGGIPLAAGAALAARQAGTQQLAVCFFGDGALNQGITFEVMNMAALWKLPVVFVCENNGYGEYTALEDVTAGSRLAARGEVFDIDTQEVDGMNVLAVLQAVEQAFERARSGGGPSLLIAHTYRYSGHHVNDQQDYKNADAIEQWQQKDPIQQLKRHLLEQNLVSAATLDAIEQAVAENIQAAADFAKAAADPSPDALSKHVYAE